MTKQTLKANRATSLMCSGLLFLLALAPLSTLSNEAASSNHSSSIQQLDSDFQEVIHAYLNEYARQNSAKYHQNGQALLKAVSKEPQKNQKNHLIRSNLNTLVQEATPEQFSLLAQHLYDSNDTATVRDLTVTLNKSNNREKISQNYFLLARYYYKRGNWPGLQAALSNVDPKNLSSGDAQFYLLLMGYSLQESKQHRKSVSYYKKIPHTSPYYAHAKLNEGIAYLRQGWWSEAHMEFNDAINTLQSRDKNQKQKDDFANRILVVLGFSQIDNEFYRDARRALRKVALNSEYTNKAMMGLGIAAAHQKDFPGALNLFERLASKSPKDKNIDEAYLLVPYSYEELDDRTNASITYQQAIQYYQARLLELNLAEHQLTNASDTLLIPTIELMTQKGKELFDQQNIIPDYFLDNYSYILHMQKMQLSKNVTSSVNALLAKYRHQIKTLTSHNIQVRTAAINSYLSQAQYGVAKLYDQE